MRQILRAMAFALMAGGSLASAEAADQLYPIRHPHPVPAAYPVAHYPGWPWVVYPAYVPAVVPDYSLPAAHFWVPYYGAVPYPAPYYPFYYP
jgi:hypothetical protein